MAIKNTHPLAMQHRHKISFRKPKVRKALHSVWGVTWNLRGKTRCRLGTASMMAMSHHPDPAQEEMIETLCVVAQTDPAEGVVHYSEVRMAHDFSKTPYVGARDRVLDPRDEGDETAREWDRPNGSWVRLGLEMSRQMSRAVDQNWRLPVVPQLPRFQAGFRSMEEIDIEVTPAMIRLIAEHMDRSVARVEKIPQEDLLTLARAHWADLWTSPDAKDNDTGLWLIDLDYTTQIRRAAKLFEDFTDLMGVEVWNPARDITRVSFKNTTRACAEEQGINIRELFRAIRRGSEEAVVEVVEFDDDYQGYGKDEEAEMTPTYFTCTYDQAVDQMLLLRNCVRGSLQQYSSKFSDDEITRAVSNPDQPLVLHVTDVFKDMGPEAALQLGREALNRDRPLISACTTDEDLLAAMANPAKPLYASKMCRVQVLRRDTRIDASEAFMFTPQMLQRDRVFANLWAGAGWTPKTKRMERYTEPRQPKKVKNGPSQPVCDKTT